MKLPVRASTLVLGVLGLVAVACETNNRDVAHTSAEDDRLSVMLLRPSDGGGATIPAIIGTPLGLGISVTEYVPRRCVAADFTSDTERCFDARWDVVERFTVVEASCDDGTCDVTRAFDRDEAGGGNMEVVPRAPYFTVRVEVEDHGKRGSAVLSSPASSPDAGADAGDGG